VSPGAKFCTLYGPVPIGFRLFGEFLALAPLSAWKMCFGMMHPDVPPNEMYQPGVTSLKETLMVRSSILSILSIVEKLA